MSQLKLFELYLAKEQHQQGATFNINHIPEKTCTILIHQISEARRTRFLYGWFLYFHNESQSLLISLKLSLPGCPRNGNIMENLEKYKIKFQVWKNHGISFFKEKSWKNHGISLQVCINGVKWILRNGWNGKRFTFDRVFCQNRQSIQFLSTYCCWKTKQFFLYHNLYFAAVEFFPKVYCDCHCI